MHVHMLWVQTFVQEKRVTRYLVLGTELHTDLLAAPEMHECLRRSVLPLEQGQSAIALQAASGTRRA